MSLPTAFQPNKQVIYEDNHLLVVQKPAGLLSQADGSLSADLLSQYKAYLKQKYQKPGEVYLGLVHRLDRPVGGLMVLAKTSKAAARLSEQVRTHRLQKVYAAVLTGGSLQQERAELRDYLRKDAKLNLSQVVNAGQPGAKLAVLEYELLQQRAEQGLSLVQVWLKTGRSHQIRCQFAHLGHPLYADHRYGQPRKGEDIALFAQGLAFEHPTKKEWLQFSLPLPRTGVWGLFEPHQV